MSNQDHSDPQYQLIMNEYESNQKWIEPFNDLLDEIYYPGYAETLAEENPETFELEYHNFLELYD